MWLIYDVIYIYMSLKSRLLSRFSLDGKTVVQKNITWLKIVQSMALFTPDQGLVCVCARACVRACVRACLRASACAYLCVCVCVHVCA